MNAPAAHTAFRPAEPDRSAAVSRRRKERRREFEALLLRSYAGMRARGRAA